MKLTVLLAKYQNVRRPREQTMRHRASVLMTFTNDTGITDTDDFTYEVLLKWRNLVLERASPVTWNNYWMALRALWNFGLEEGLIEAAPFARMKRERVEKRRPKTVDQQDIKDAIDYLLQDDEPMRPGWFWATVVRTLYYTGMRRNQLIGLRWEHLSSDYATCTLAADHSKNWYEYGIALDPRVSVELKALRVQTSEVVGRAPLYREQVFNVTLFCHRYHGHELTLGQVSAFFRRLSNAMGVRITAHMLRHTMATKLMQETGQLPVISAILGHHDARSTLRYLHPDLGQQRGIIEKLPYI